MAVVLRCPECEGKFRHQFSEKSRWPENCPLCKAQIGVDREDDDVVMPAFLSAKTRSNDALYRQIERSSEQRAEHAAGLAGCSAADMSSLKVTDLQSTTHQGDAAVPQISAENNEVVRHMQAMNARGGHFGFQGADAAGYSGAVQTGPAPNAGAKMRNALQAHHGQISSGSAVSDRPALETLAPGYRRRA